MNELILRSYVFFLNFICYQLSVISRQFHFCDVLKKRLNFNNISSRKVNLVQQISIALGFPIN